MCIKGAETSRQPPSSSVLYRPLAAHQSRETHTYYSSASEHAILHQGRRRRRSRDVCLCDSSRGAPALRPPFCRLSYGSPRWNRFQSAGRHQHCYVRYRRDLHRTRYPSYW
ncbi:uncharacterized protein FOMMEDRAFT_165012 [Fomitiporia mediterranea MF3/22]|uniref:uncharacterized protein n=1 Tax=Fomitiporia mediterranea (strain MF3/22) TaxID=694068 RepID=UPI000440946A|nr:uncharacterized protein FOMMEDRAFT_165012 [Fomitiporia mediterranea MF3/22]EJD08418.1 hypothetical protein FOMMEDRAFT_165012 [Fomitiporia mediterranea MF3/22]